MIETIMHWFSTISVWFSTMTVTMAAIPKMYYIGGCAAFLLSIGAYILAALLFSKNSDMLTFYITLPNNRFAFRTKGGNIIGIMHNVEGYKLVEATGFPYGKFVPDTDPRKELQKIGPIEELLGARFVGIPFIHGIFQKKMTWVDSATFVAHNNETVWNFAVTKTFGYLLKDLTLGGDSDSGMSEGNKPKNQEQTKEEDDVQKRQRLKVNIKLLLQQVVEGPHEAMVNTNSMAGTEAKLSRIVQGYLGKTSQDELIEQKTEPGERYCPLVKTIVSNILDLQNFGLTFSKEKITYVRYELAGSPETIARIEEANNKKYVASQEAAALRLINAAKQEGLKGQRLAIKEILTDCVEQNMTSEEARDIILSVMQAKQVENLADTQVTTYIAGGASAGVNLAVPTGNGNKEQKGKRPDKDKGAKK